MASKRKTKAQREAEQKAALMQRILDIYARANGGQVCDDDVCFPIVLARVIPSVREIFGSPSPNWFGWGPQTLGEWETPQGACDLLWRHGFRADEKWEDTDAT